MVIEATAIGAATGVLTNTITSDKKLVDQHALIEDIHTALLELIQYLKKTDAIEPDIYRVVQFGGFIFNPNLDVRKHMYLLSPQQVLLAVQCSTLGNFSISIPQAVWTRVDLPESSTLSLDSSNPFTGINVLVRYSDADL